MPLASSCLAPPPDQNYAQDIIRGITDAARSLGIRAARLEGATSDDLNDDVFAEVVKVLRAAPEIDGIIACSTPSAMSVAAGVEAAGKKIGEEIDLIGKETSQLLHLFRPKIISFFEDVTMAGEFLARAAIQAVEKPDSPPMQELEMPDITRFQIGEDILNAKLKGLPNGIDDEGRGSVSGAIRGG